MSTTNLHSPKGVAGMQKGQTGGATITLASHNSSNQENKMSNLANNAASNSNRIKLKKKGEAAITPLQLACQRMAEQPQPIIKQMSDPTDPPFANSRPSMVAPNDWRISVIEKSSGVPQLTGMSDVA